GAERSLREYRGQTIVLLVFFRLPQSLGRLSRLAEAHFDFRAMGSEILAVPLEASGATYQALGRQLMLFPFVIEGAEATAAAYGLFRLDPSAGARHGGSPAPAHMELLVDRQGYLRARWLAEGLPDAAGGWSDVTTLLGEVDRLAREPASAPVADEQVR